MDIFVGLGALFGLLSPSGQYGSHTLLLGNFPKVRWVPSPPWLFAPSEAVLCLFGMRLSLLVSQGCVEDLSGLCRAVSLPESLC